MNQTVKDRLASLKSSVARICAYEAVVSAQADRLEAESSSSKMKSELFSKCSEIFKKWLEDSMERNVGSMADLATTGLRHVIPDQELIFKIKQEPKYNRMSMRFVLEQDGVEGDPINSYGGGAAVVVSLILRIAVMQRMGMGNLLILDESMVALANVYVPSAASFIRKLAEQAGVNILMVTHNPEFLASAHVAYEGFKDSSMKLRRIGEPR
jgi:DNA repair exonuclease SbcCD ATPase subunit